MSRALDNAVQSNLTLQSAICNLQSEMKPWKRGMMMTAAFLLGKT